MSITLVNPAGLPTVEAYQQVSVAAGSKLVFIAGQVARDADGEKVGEGDFVAQVDQSFRNVVTALVGVGGRPDDLARLTVYVVDWTLDKMPLLVEGLTRATAKVGSMSVPPSTLIGVTALAEPDLMVEIEATAVID